MTQVHLLDLTMGERRPDLSTRRTAARDPDAPALLEPTLHRPELHTKGLGGEAGTLEVTDAACVRPAQNASNPTHQESEA